MSLVPFVHIDASLDGALAGEELALSPGEAHHLSTVLRLAEGRPVEVADGNGWWAAAETAGGAVRLTAPARCAPVAVPQLLVAQALPKGRKFDEVTRQITELGVDRVIPVETERCVSRIPGDKAERVVTRWRAVARSASEQSRRAHRPSVSPVVGIDAVAGLCGDDGAVVLVAHPGAPGLPSRLPDCVDVSQVVVVVGPEGGLTPAEVGSLESAGALLAGLGPTTLRTEHAAAAAVAALAAALGRWD